MGSLKRPLRWFKRLHRSGDAFNEIGQGAHVADHEGLFDPGWAGLTLTVDPDCRVTQFVGRDDIVFEAETGVPDFAHGQAQTLAGKVKTLMAGLVGSGLLSSDDLIEGDADGLLCFADDGIVGIGDEDKQLPLPLVTLRGKMASWQKVTILCGQDGTVPLPTVPIMLKSSLSLKQF